MSLDCRVNFIRFIFLLTIILSCFGFSVDSLGEKCNTQIIFDQCGPNQICKTNTTFPGFGICECLLQFVRKGNDCVPVQLSTQSPPVSPSVSPKDDHQTGSGGGFPVSIWLIVPCLIVAVVSGLVFMGRRYMWMERLYQLRVRHYDTVLINNQDDNITEAD